jgi:hypothetical protein
MDNDIYQQKKQEFIEALHNNEVSLAHLAEDDPLLHDFDIVYEAVSLTATALLLTPNELRKNTKIVQKALETFLENDDEDPESKDVDFLFDVIPNELKSDEQLGNTIVSKYGQWLRFFDGLKNNEKTVKLAFHENENSLVFASNELKDNETFMLDILKIDGSSLMHASSRLRKKENIVMEAIKQNILAYKYVAQGFHNIEISLMVFEKNPCYAWKELTEDPETKIIFIKHLETKSEDYFIKILKELDKPHQSSTTYISFGKNGERITPPTEEYTETIQCLMKPLTLKTLKSLEEIIKTPFLIKHLNEEYSTKLIKNVQYQKHTKSTKNKRIIF